MRLNMEQRKALGALFKGTMSANDLSVQQLSDKLGVKHTQVRKWMDYPEKLVGVRTATIVKLEKSFGKPFSELIGGESSVDIDTVHRGKLKKPKKHKAKVKGNGKLVELPLPTQPTDDGLIHFLIADGTRVSVASGLKVEFVDAHTIKVT